MPKNSKSKEKQSVPAGGPATINGVLYQLLWSLLRASRASIGSVSTDAAGNVEQVLMTLEPTGGGGDLVVAEGSRKIVEQLKARPDGGTWSLREMVEDVIPDLYIACSETEPDTEFRFVTEGRMGRWEKVYDFLQSLRQRPCPTTDPISDSGLKPTVELPFSGSTKKAPTASEAFWDEELYTEVSLFERIVKEVRKRKAVSKREDEPTTRRGLWQLLGHFEFVGGQDMARLQREIDARLMAVVDIHEDVPRIRDALSLDLGRLAAAGGAVIEAREFFSKHGLNAVPLTEWSRLRERAAKERDSFLTRRGYDGQLDVRVQRAADALAAWTASTPILAVSGESGQGKSWLAYRMAVEAALCTPQVVVLVDATGRADDTLRVAAETLWQTIARHDAYIPMSQIADRVKRVLGTGLQTWMLLVIDGVQEQSEAIALAKKKWGEWGIRVILTCHPRLAGRVEQESYVRSETAVVEDFTVEELHEYMRRCFGEEWPTIPDTVWFALRRPLLANLYRQLAVDSTWQPEREYEFYEAFWKRLDANDPLDSARLRRLIAATLDGGSYPWSQQQLIDASIDSDSVKRFERSGWMHTIDRSSGPHFEISHDRLLNWAVAEALVDRLRESRHSADSIGQRLHDYFTGQSTLGGRNLGFALMDVLWLALRDEGLSDEVQVLLLVMERHRHSDRSFYSETIPTLGGRVVASLARRLKAVIADAYSSRRIADSIGAIGGAQADECALAFVHSDNPLLQRSGMRILRHSPVVGVLDRLWELHIEGKQTPNRFLRQHEIESNLNEDSYSALRECSRREPSWLDDAIRRSDSQKEPTHVLAHLLADIGGASGHDIWMRHKDLLMRSVSPDKQRCIARCIDTYSDIAEIDWLRRCVPLIADVAGAKAMSVLARLAPHSAIQHLDSLPLELLSPTRDWYADQLFAYDAPAMHWKLLAMMRASESPWSIAAMYQRREHFMDRNTLAFLLDNLQDRLEEVVSNSADVESLHSPFQVMSRLETREQLEEFTARRGSALELHLVDVLLRIGPRSGLSSTSSVRAPALDVLYRIGGIGFTEVVNRFLQGESRYGRLDAIELAAKRPSEDTIRLLTMITERDETWEGHFIEQCHAAERLLDIGEWPPVIRLVRAIGVKTDSRITQFPRRGYRPAPELANEARARAVTAEVAPGDLYIIGMAGQKEDAKVVREVLSTAPPESDVAHAAVLALELLEDDSEDAVKLLSGQLRIQAHEFSATNALIANGTQPALDALRQHVRGRFDVAVAINLVNCMGGTPDVLVEVRRTLESELEERGWWDFAGNLELVLRYVGSNAAVSTLLESKAIREYLRSTSFAGEGSSWVTGSKAAAILCLARFDPQAAFLAAKTALSNEKWHDRERYPFILMDLDAHRATPLLLDQLVIEKAKGVIYAICRALAVDGIDDALRTRLRSSDLEQRRVACIAAGWASRTPDSESELRSLLSDRNENVAKAAAEAISRIERRKVSRQLADALMEESNQSERWLFVDCLLTMADPGDPHQKWPADGPDIGAVLSPLQISHCTDRLKKLRESVDR